MKFIDLDYPSSKEELLSMLRDNDKVNEGVEFDKSRGIPHMKLREKGKKIKITCEMKGLSKKDNGFIVGTYFSGSITEKDGRARLKGIITTAPIYHLVLILLIGVFLFECIRRGGFSIIPIFVVAFDILLFKDEFRKQKYIEHYFYRAYKRLKRRK